MKPKRLITAVRGIPLAARFYQRIRNNQKVGASINITGRCPIGCSCYWREQRARDYDIPVTDIRALNLAGKKVEMSDDKLLSLLHRLREQGYLLVKLVGGEPYVRRDLLPRLTGILPWTWLATSGTTPLVRLTRTTQFISIDGADSKTHDEVRQSPGLFERIIKNLRTAKEEAIPHLHIHMVLNLLNYSQAERVIENFCLRERLVGSVTFSLHTSTSGEEGKHLQLPQEQWQYSVNTLRQIQRQYPKLVSMSPAMIDRLEWNHVTQQTPATCPTATFVDSIAEDGSLIPQCIFGPNANCSQCGCVITGLLGSLADSFDLTSARIAARMIPLWD